MVGSRVGHVDLFRELASSGKTLDARESETFENLPNCVGSYVGNCTFSSLAEMPNSSAVRRVVPFPFDSACTSPAGVPGLPRLFVGR